MTGIALWPPAASEEAVQVDAIFIALLVLSALVLAVVAALLLVFCIRYRRGSTARRGPLPEALRREVELGWTAATLFLALFLFWWAGATQLHAVTPPRDALEIHVIARQWMWKVRHPGGAREIDALHVPRGEAVRLVMTSQDVIHSFFVPAFRIKQDVLPGRFTEMWFRATRIGTYDLFCAEFCGTQHATMRGSVTVMEPDDYARWAAARPSADGVADQGAALYVALGCHGCHAAGTAVRAPPLAGLYGRMVERDGRRVRADARYLREAILHPRRDVAAGYEAVMPSYDGVVDEAQLGRLVAYLQSLHGEAGP